MQKISIISILIYLNQILYLAQAAHLYGFNIANARNRLYRNLRVGKDENFYDQIDDGFIPLFNQNQPFIQQQQQQQPQRDDIHTQPQTTITNFDLMQTTTKSPLTTAKPIFNTDQVNIFEIKDSISSSNYNSNPLNPNNQNQNNYNSLNSFIQGYAQNFNYAYYNKPFSCDYSIDLTALPSDCRKFRRCSNGNLYIMDCPRNLMFDNRIRACNWPEEVIELCGVPYYGPSP